MLSEDATIFLKHESITGPSMARGYGVRSDSFFDVATHTIGKAASRVRITMCIVQEPSQNREIFLYLHIFDNSQIKIVYVSSVRSWRYHFLLHSFQHRPTSKCKRSMVQNNKNVVY